MCVCVCVTKPQRIEKSRRCSEGDHPQTIPVLFYPANFAFRSHEGRFVWLYPAACASGWYRQTVHGVFLLMRAWMSEKREIQRWEWEAIWRFKKWLKPVSMSIHKKGGLSSLPSELILATHMQRHTYPRSANPPPCFNPLGGPLSTAASGRRKMSHILITTFSILKLHWFLACYWDSGQGKENRAFCLHPAAVSC